MTVAASVRYMTASAMSLTVEGRPIGAKLSITNVAIDQRDVVGSRNLSRLSYLQGSGDDVETPFDKRFHDARADPSDAPVTMAVFRGSPIVAYLQNQSKIRIQHDAVTDLA